MNNHLVPVAYYAYWIILMAIMVLILGYWALRPKTGASGADTGLLSGVLVLLVSLLYAIDQLPALHIHFDALAAKFVGGYHEPLTQGFIRFGYKVGIAILLLGYAFGGVKKHH
jgi:hypothetical protein